MDSRAAAQTSSDSNRWIALELMIRLMIILWG